MKYIFQWRLRKKRGKALVRLARMRAFNEMINQIGGYKGGRAFMVDTSKLKVEPPYLIVTERYSMLKLKFTYAIANVCSYHRRRFEIIMLNDSLTYLIY